MTATAGLVLAAGRGTRLRPLTEAVAKPALPVLDVPLGAWGLGALGALGVPITVNVSHLPDSVTRALGTQATPFETFVEAPEPFGTGGTLRALRERVGGRLIVWNCDAVADLGLEQLLASHVSSGCAATIAVTSVPTGADFSVRGGRAVELIDRRRQDVPGARFIGIAVYEQEVLDAIPDRRPLGATEAVLLPLLEEGRLGAHEHRGYACDVGTLDRYLRVSLDLVEGSAPPPPGGVPGDIVDAVGGRAYIGPGAESDAARIGSGAVLLAGSSVAAGAAITRAIVWPGERVPPGAELRDCIWFGGRALPAQAAASA